MHSKHRGLGMVRELQLIPVPGTKGYWRETKGYKQWGWKGLQDCVPRVAGLRTDQRCSHWASREPLANLGPDLVGLGFVSHSQTNALKGKHLKCWVLCRAWHNSWYFVGFSKYLLSESIGTWIHLTAWKRSRRDPSGDECPWDSRGSHLWRCRVGGPGWGCVIERSGKIWQGAGRWEHQDMAGDRPGSWDPRRTPDWFDLVSPLGQWHVTVWALLELTPPMRHGRHWKSRQPTHSQDSMWSWWAISWLISAHLSARASVQPAQAEPPKNSPLGPWTRLSRIWVLFPNSWLVRMLMVGQDWTM